MRKEFMHSCHKGSFKLKKIDLFRFYTRNQVYNSARNCFLFCLRKKEIVAIVTFKILFLSKKIVFSDKGPAYRKRFTYCFREK